MALIERFDIKKEVFNKILENPNKLENINLFFSSLFTKNPEKNYNINKAFQFQQPVRVKDNEDDEENIKIRVKATDNYYLQYAGVGDKKSAYDSEKGAAASVEIVSPAEATVTVNVYDYADNVNSVDISTVIKDDDGNIYTSLKDAVQAAPDGDSTLYVENYCEVISETVLIPEDKNITITGTAKFSKKEDFVTPSVKVLGSFNVDEGVQGLDLSVIPKVIEFSVSDGEITAFLSAPADNYFAGVFAAAYDRNGRLTDCAVLQGEADKTVAPLGKGERYAVFVWDLRTFKPYRTVVK